MLSGITSVYVPYTYKFLRQVNFEDVTNQAFSRLLSCARMHKRVKQLFCMSFSMKIATLGNLGVCMGYVLYRALGSPTFRKFADIMHIPTHMWHHHSLLLATFNQDYVRRIKLPSYISHSILGPSLTWPGHMRLIVAISASVQNGFL